MGKISGKKFVAMYLAACLLATSVCMPFMRPKKVEAAATVSIGSLVGYALTAMGAVNILTNGGVARVAGSVYDVVKQKIMDYFGYGIYEDSNGNYVFGGEATQAIYEALDSMPGISARVVSDFGSNPSVMNSSLWTPLAASNHANYTRNQSNYIIYAWVSEISGSSTVRISYIIRYTSNIAYIVISQNGQINYYNANGNLDSTSGYAFSYTYNPTTGSFTNPTTSAGTGVWPSVDYLSFPSNFIYSNRSIILGQDSPNGLSAYSYNSGTIVNNNFTEIPPVSKNVIENNDWDNIYTSYVNNINNQKDVYYNSSTGLNVTALRRVMKNYGDEIAQAIEEGASDISDRVNYLNNWMSLIYDRIGIIYDFLSGGESVPSVDYTTILSAIKTDTGNIDTRLINIYAYLDTIVSAINRVNTGISIDGSPNITIDHIFDDIMSISVDGITGYISKGQVFTSVAKNVSPLVFFEGMGDILEGLSSAPPSGYAPSWTIPFKVRNASVGLDVDEEIEIDLSGFSSVHDILIAFECLLFILFLMVFTVQMLRDVLYIFS